MKDKKLYIGLIIVLIIVLAIILGIVLNNKSDDKENITTNEDNFVVVEPENTTNSVVEDPYENLTTEQINELVKDRSVGNVSLQIKEGTLTREGVTIIIADKNDYPYVYSENYTLEKLENGEWKVLEPTTLDSRDLGHKANNEGIVEMDINWKQGYGELENGKYRISKQVIEGNPDTVISAEFEIK